MGKKSKPVAAVALAPAIERALEEVDAACRAEAWESYEDNVLQAAATLEAAVGQLRRAWHADIGDTVVECDAAARAQQRTALLDWALASGATAHAAVTLDAFGQSGGTRVVAAAAVEAGAVVFAIPQRLMLRACGADAIGAFALALEGASPTVALAVRVAHEALKGDASDWAPYLAALPRSFDLPLCWPADALAVLRGSPALHRACGSRRAAAKAYCEVVRAARVSPALAAALPLCKFDWALWEWAMGAVVTRQNAVPDAAKPRDAPKLALVPLWDMCNHKRGAATTEFVVRGPSEDGESGFLEMRAAGQVAPGAEIAMCYGARSNSEFVLHSGFFDDETNPNDRVDVYLQFDDPRDKKLDALLATLLEGAGVPLTKRGWRGFLVHSPDGAGGVVTDAALLAALLAAVADKPQAAHLMRCAHAGAPWTAADGLHSSKVARRLQDKIAAQVEARIAAAPDAPGEAARPHHAQIALRLVRAEVALLRQGGDYARAILADAGGTAP